MSRIETIFNSLRSQKRKALMPFVVAGYPSMDATEKVIIGASNAGASIMEIGIPFSDPIADGPVIAGAMYEALSNGVTPSRIFELVTSVRKKTDLGLVAMVSESIVHRMGGNRFVSTAAEAGFDGLIIPDLDLDAAPELSTCAKQHGMAFTMLIAPTTSAARMKKIADVSHGFLYVLARTGLTGEKSTGPDVSGRIAEIRAVTDLPLAVGFGISTPEQVRDVNQSADAAIVGSALVRRMGSATDPAASALDFNRELAGGLD